jgi:anhydro-N-acetylmuramic acid kinase
MVYALGVMTGTSCDGADAALLEFRKEGGAWKETLKQVASKKFPSELRTRLRKAQKGGLNIPQAAKLTQDYSIWLGKFCDALLKSWHTDRAQTLIALHGQTVWHEPQNKKIPMGFSVQLLDPSIVAYFTRCTVTASFRQPDLARAGHGAPLLPYYHWLRASTEFEKDLPIAVQNIGGIANLTYVDKDESKVIAFDTGPANALIDLATEAHTRGKMLYDRGGKIAAQNLSAIKWREIEKLGREPYFVATPPKSTGRELFNESYLRKIPGTGAAKIANATALTAHTMAKAYVDFVLTEKRKLRKIYVAGGGALNPTLLLLFAHELRRLGGIDIPIEVLPKEFAPSQYLEAMGFARFGFEAIQGKPVSLAVVTGAKENAIGAGIFPSQNYQKLLKLLFY